MLKYKIKIKPNKNQAGFTLAELIVSIFIIAFISGIFLVNYHSTNQRSNLVITAQKVISDIKLTESYCLGSKEYNSAMPSGGWGIYFSIANPASYIIFADENENKQYDIGEADSAKGGKTMNLPAGISLDNINIGDGSRADIVFLPPDPTIYINGAGIAVRLRFKENISDSTKTIEVNSFGLAEAVD